jgi:hypothetical protein
MNNMPSVEIKEFKEAYQEYPQIFFMRPGNSEQHNTSTELSKKNMKMAVFWVVAPCSLVEVYQCFGGPCCLHHHSDDHGKVLPDYIHT